MRSRIAQLCGLLLLALSFSCAATPAIVAPASDWAPVATDLRAAIEYEMADKKLPNLAIALVDDGRIVWAEGFGIADAASGTATSSQTLWRVGSVSKLFTDMAVMRLVESGELDLDAPVRDVLPSWMRGAERAQAITLRQLMSHRAGLVREPPVGHYFDPTRPSLAQTVDSLDRTRLVYDPGTRTKYSNAGIATVGRALEVKAGQPFASYMREQLLAPMGMASANFERTDAVESSLADGLMWGYDSREFAAPDLRLGLLPASDLYASVEDLAHFMQVLFAGGVGPQGRIIDETTLEQMMKPSKDAAGRRLPFGIGFAVGELDSHKRCGHGGAIYGFATELAFLPQEKLGVVVVCGVDVANSVTRRLADHALSSMLASRAGERAKEYERFTPVAAAVARRVAGSYKANERELELVERYGELHARWGSKLVAVRAAGSDLMLDGRLGRGPRIERRDDGDLQIGDLRYARTAGQAPPPCPSEWRELIGEYGWDHNVLFILEERGQLTALIEWFWYEPLHELADGRFAFPESGGLYHGEALEFRRDAQGRIESVALGELVFPRRDRGNADGETFVIEPLHPIAELRKTALAASPPREDRDFRESALVDVRAIDPALHLDIRYASTNNFMGNAFYRQARAFMQRPAAEALARVHARLRSQGYGLLIHDAYRPWYVTRMFWDGAPQDSKDFVADPSKGSRHNRGCAVDLTLCDLTTGKPVTMVSSYDEFNALAGPAYPGGTARQRWHRELLRHEMEAESFTVYRNEWWHFDFEGWEHYPIFNETFEELAERGIK